jgi:hypothetical protein
MWFSRLLLVLGMVALLGCGPQETTEKVEALSSQSQVKAALETLAETGQMDSGVMLIQEQLEAMKETDSAKATELLADLEALMPLKDPAEIKAKAQAMIDKL